MQLLELLGTKLKMLHAHVPALGRLGARPERKPGTAARHWADPLDLLSRQALEEVRICCLSAGAATPA
eukprot:8432222-Alexandrium_andersonii.AAC.1